MFHLYKKSDNTEKYWVSDEDYHKLKVKVYDSNQCGLFLIRNDRGELDDIFEIPCED